VIGLDEAGFVELEVKKGNNMVIPFFDSLIHFFYSVAYIASCVLELLNVYYIFSVDEKCHKFA